MRKSWLYFAICLSVLIFVGCSSETEPAATAVPAQISSLPAGQPSSSQAVSPTGTPAPTATTVPTSTPTEVPTATPTATPSEGVMTGQVVEALAGNAAEIELLQVEDHSGRVWQFYTEGPIGIDAGHLLVHRDTNEEVEVVYEQKAGRLFALEVNDVLSR